MLDGAGLQAAIVGSFAKLAPRADEVLGWQPLILGKNAVCAACNDVLMRGADGAVAITDGAGPRAIVCPRCLEEIRHGRDPFA